MVPDPQTLSYIIMGAEILGVAFLAALWLSLIIWTYRDISSRSRSPFFRILAVIIVALLFLPGIVIYLILRLPRTLAEEYKSSLEEEELLQSIEDLLECPGCGRRIEAAWMVCPTCHTRLKKPCLQCHQLMELSWNLCPYCGNPVPGVRKENQTTHETSQSSIFKEVEPPEESELTQEGSD